MNPFQKYEKNSLLRQRNCHRCEIFDQEWYLLDKQEQFAPKFHYTAHLSPNYSAVKFTQNHLRLYEIN